MTADEMRKIDQLTIRDFQIGVLTLMENAGRAVATLAKSMLHQPSSGKRVACLVGGGNNGGDGMVAARHLVNWGMEVDVILGTTRDRIRDVPLGQLTILEKMDLPIFYNDYDLGTYDLLVVGLIGYGLEGNPRDRVATMIRDANKSRLPILAVDVPSGMNSTTGQAYDPCIKAASTLTLALPKTGFLSPESAAYSGQMYLADISIPRKIYQKFGQKTELFQEDTIIKI